MLTDILTSVGALLFILALAWVSLKIMRKIQTTNPSISSLRYLGALSLGPRERIVLINYQEDILLIGITEGSMSLLDRRLGPENKTANGEKPF